MKSIPIQPWQAKAAKEGRLRRLIVPIWPQPQGVLRYHWSSRSETCAPVWLDSMSSVKCPFSVGNAVGLQEAFIIEATNDIGDVQVRYLSDFSFSVKKCPDSSKLLTNAKRVSSTMPSWAIRHYFTPTDIQAKTLGGLTEREAMECGIKDRQVAMRADSGSIEGAYDPMDYEDDISATRMAAFEFEWTHQYRRRPALAWNEKLWVWSVAGKVEVI